MMAAETMALATFPVIFPVIREILGFDLCRVLFDIVKPLGGSVDVPRSLPAD
jgi:hypothetical protein